MARKKTTRKVRRRQGPGGGFDRVRDYFRDGGSASERVNSGPPPPPPEDERERQGPAPIGVPRDYRVPSVVTERPAGTADSLARHAEAGMGQGAIVSRGPRYFDGDEWKIAATSPQAVVAIQRALATAGLLEDFQLGLWDKRSADAYAEVLAYANAAGISDQMALQRFVESPELAMGGGGSGGRGGRQIIGFDENGDPIYSEYVPPPLEVKTTNKDDLKRLFRSLTAEKLGIAWSQAQIDELVDAYNWQEIRVQSSNYDQQVALERQAFNEGPEAVAGRTLSMEEAPSPEAFAEQQLLSRDRTGYHAAQVGLQGVDMFREALARWS